MILIPINSDYPSGVSVYLWRHGASSRRVTMYLDADVLEHFKARAGQPNAAPYQTQINHELRSVMERDQGGVGSGVSAASSVAVAQLAGILSNDYLIAAIAARVRALNEQGLEKVKEIPTSSSVLALGD